MTAPGLPCPLSELVPHQPPMRWLDELEVFTAEAGEVVGIVADDHLFAGADRHLHPAALIELVAQGAAAHEGYKGLLEGRPVGGGFLAGIRAFRIHASPRCGDSLRVCAHRTLAIGAIEQVKGQVLRGSEVLAEGELLFFLSQEPVPDEIASDSPTAVLGEDGHSRQSLLPALAECQLSSQPGSAVYSFAPSFPAFRGHFPDFPLLPAVVGLAAAMEAVASAAGSSPQFIKRAKFMRPILPGAEVTVDYKKRGKLWQTNLEVAGAAVAKITMGEP